MVQAYKKFWLGAFTFNKKTSRKDFWSALLTHIIIFVILFKAYHFFNLLDFYQLTTLWQTFASFFQLIFNLYFFGSLLSFIALTVRRLNDADLPWGLIFLNFILGLGTLVLLIIIYQRQRHYQVYSRTILKITLNFAEERQEEIFGGCNCFGD